MILRHQFNKSDDAYKAFDRSQDYPSFKRNGLVDLSVHPLNDCKHLVGIDLFRLLIENTKWLDVEAMNEIKGLIVTSTNCDFYIKNLLHRLDQVSGKIELSVMRYDYRRLKNLATLISGLTRQLIDAKNGAHICPDVLLKDLNQLGNEARFFSCTLPIINLPSGKKTVQLAKLKCSKWWFRKLNKKINQQRELLKIAIGVVCYQNQPYASNEIVNAYQRKVEAEKEYLSTISFKCNRTGNNICLADLKSSDQRRYSEFLVSSKGIEKRAKSLGLVSSLLTLTLPSQYHPNPANGDSLSWQGYTPEEGYIELTSLTNRFNKMIHKACLYENNGYYSIRTVESHHDATCHFHILIFYRPEFKGIIQNAISHQFSDDCFNEKSKAYKWVDIDENKSSPVYYLCKHFTYSNDDEKNKDNIRISANKYIWNIKSFEHTGLPGGTKTLWKKLRKNKTDALLNDIEKKLYSLAINNDFHGFLTILEHSDCVITISYKTTVSKYGEDVVTVSGVSVTENKTQQPKKGYFFNMKNQVLDCYLIARTKTVKVVTNISKVTENVITKIQDTKSNVIAAKIKGFFTSIIKRQ